jgi:hypothetical protein
MVGSLDKYTGVFQEQVDAFISQDDPVSTTIYPVLPTSMNVKIHSIEEDITWAITQPNPMQVRVTVDGITIIHSQVDPVSATPYYCRRIPGVDAVNQLMTTDQAIAMNEAAPLYEGRSVRVDCLVIWAANQSTPLVCRVKWAQQKPA